MLVQMGLSSIRGLVLPRAGRLFLHTDIIMPGISLGVNSLGYVTSPAIRAHTGRVQALEY